MERAAQKRKVDLLFLAHAIFALVAGSAAFIAPHVFEWFMVHHGEALTLRSNSDSESKITHLVIRLYGALILAQSWIVWSARKCDAQIRKAMIQVRPLYTFVNSELPTSISAVQAYWFCFSLTALALIRAQVTGGGGLNDWNWINIAMFMGLALCYAWFAFFERISVFDSLDKGVL